MERKTVNYLEGARCSHPMEITLYNGAGTNTDTLPYEARPLCPVLFGGKCLQEKSSYYPCRIIPDIKET